DPEKLRRMLALIGRVTRRLPVIFPVHPRTRARLDAVGGAVPRELRLIPPQGYLDFIALTDGARLVLTDSGGIQEETTSRGVPCPTLRENTERPITCQVGTNVLVGEDEVKLEREMDRILGGAARATDLRTPDLWDGRASDRIVAVWRRDLPS